MSHTHREREEGSTTKFESLPPYQFCFVFLLLILSAPGHLFAEATTAVADNALGATATEHNKPLDLSDTTVDLGEVVPDEIIIRFRTPAAAALHARRMVDAPGDCATWLNNAARAGLRPLPPQVIGLRPLVSGHDRAHKVLEAHPEFASQVSAMSNGQPLQSDFIAEVANVLTLTAATDPFGPLNSFCGKLSPQVDLRETCLRLMERDDVEYAHPSPIYHTTL